ncbi:MAG: hypothetical protein ACOVP6_09800 [Lacibacter sp.]
MGKLTDGLENTAYLWGSGEDGVPDLEMNNYYMNMAKKAKGELEILERELRNIK